MCWSAVEMRIRPLDRSGVGESGDPGRMKSSDSPTEIVKTPSTGEC